MTWQQWLLPFRAAAPCLERYSCILAETDRLFEERPGWGGDGASWCLGRVSTLDNHSPPSVNILPDFTHKCIFIYSDKLFLSKSSSALRMSSQLQD